MSSVYHEIVNGILRFELTNAVDLLFCYDTLLIRVAGLSMKFIKYGRRGLLTHGFDTRAPLNEMSSLGTQDHEVSNIWVISTRHRIAE